MINTRGFNSTTPVRSLQLIDGVDNQSPGLNLSLGNFLGASELDLQKVELIAGASSAYYGPNAFNGVISMTTRSPFTSPGLEVSVKAGERNLNEIALRWAQVFKNKKGAQKLGYKLNLSFLKANDWAANNMAATQQSLNNTKNPGGYDAVNIYGDEYIQGADYTQQGASYPGLGVYYRKGYAEQDLVDYNTWNVKANGAIYYKINPKTEAIFASNFCTGSTIYQGEDRYMLKNVLFYQNRVELRQENKWFIRAYTTNENSGGSYDIYFTALQLQREAKSNSDWKTDYENYWNEHYNLSYVQTLPGFPPTPGPGAPYLTWLEQINPFLATHYNDSLVAWHDSAQNYANGIGSVAKNKPFFQPGTQRFDTALAGITSRKIGNNGTFLYDRSALYHVQGEYKFTPAFCDITVGGNFRIYKPVSEGTIFADTGKVMITNKELGVYGGIEKKILSGKVKLNATLRMDKNENFPYLFSPAASVVYHVAEQHYLRLSLSSAIRNPTLTDQYLYYNTGNALLVGNLKGFNGLVTIPSLIKSYDNNQNFDSLSYFNVKPVQPEQVKTIELGYRATLFEHLYMDIDGYYSWYAHFIGYKIGAQVDTLHLHTPYGAYSELNINNIYRVATNSENVVTTSGVSVSFNYYIKIFTVSANYSWNNLDLHGSADPLIPAYNTPANKFNIGFSARDISYYSFNINYKWVQGFQFEGSPTFTGYIKTYDLLDAQANRKFPKMHTTLKIGASNILNNKHYEVYGGPLIGRLFYVSALVALTGKQ